MFGLRDQQSEDPFQERPNVMKHFSRSVSSPTWSHSSEPECSDDIEGAQPKLRTHRTLAPNLTRRSHKKSRGGCFNCKSRKIKVRLSVRLKDRDRFVCRRSSTNETTPYFNEPLLIYSTVSRVSSKLRKLYSQGAGMQISNQSRSTSPTAHQ
jgi:hypothetical protein